ncbi:uncharacterized protein LOC111022131 [Momordica charantia]|uniref:Uncharacterized protein LOC111022131 n=1 Tax=Momordica charantia TaxID=3673 RepID=A0A6J1DN60_MOMCH|nr:uncharacterized protein LOC111022131 [Momordica charantia]
MQSFRRINQLVRRKSPDAHFKSTRGYPVNGDVGCSCSAPMLMENGFAIARLFGNPYGSFSEIKVLDKKKVRRAKLYYLRDKMNALKKQ